MGTMGAGIKRPYSEALDFSQGSGSPRDALVAVEGIVWTWYSEGNHWRFGVGGPRSLWGSITGQPLALTSGHRGRCVRCHLPDHDCSGERFGRANLIRVLSHRWSQSCRCTYPLTIDWGACGGNQVYHRGVDESVKSRFVPVVGLRLGFTTGTCGWGDYGHCEGTALDFR